MSIESPDGSRRVVAEDSDGRWAARLEARTGARWSRVAELLGPKGWPMEHQGHRHHVPATAAEAQAGTLRLAGNGQIGDHPWKIEDQLAFQGQRLRLVRRWTHDGEARQEDLTLLIEARCPTGGSQHFLLPGISCNGNPSSHPDRVVPRFPAERPARCLYEEHRYPLPMASCEWRGAEGPMALALLVRPARIGAEEDDHWWSLGLALQEDAAVLVAASGAVETNGRRGAVYGAQGQLADVEDWLVRAAPGQTFEKVALLECGPPEPRGYGFRRGLWAAHALFEPQAQPALSLDQFVDLKLNALRARYVEGGDIAGYLCVPQKNAYRRGRYFQWGWVGQALLGSWCALHEGRRRGKEALERQAVRAADFFVEQLRGRAEGELPALRYDLAAKRWVHRQAEDAEGVSSRQLGEALTNLARLVELGRQLGLAVDRWLEGLERGADFLAAREHRSPEGLLPHGWTPEGQPLPGPPGAAGAPCVSALALAGVLTGRGPYRVAARELLVAYHRAFLADLSTPPWGSTLDAWCEDKEAGLTLLAATLDAYESIGEGRFLDWARLAADWALTFFYVWHPGFPPGKPCRGRARAVGWPTVSVQNHHLDAFALPSLFLRLAQATDDERYRQLARTMAQATTQSVARKGSPWGFNRPQECNVAGEQGEAIFHTNYWQGPGDRSLWRGGYTTWNPLWVCVVPLREAIVLREAGLAW
ncbi:MAG: hypothetical protein ACLF0G_01960 [Candidatus Brocadiia bacterium]